MKSIDAVFRRELLLLAGVVLIGVLLGLLSGLPAATALVIVVFYAVSLLWRMNSIVRWLDSGAKASSTPPTFGIGSQTVALVHREKKYSKKQKLRLRNALAQFNNLASELPDATVVLDSLRQIRWANAASQSLLGIHPERDRGQRIDNLIRAPGFRDLLTEGDRGDDTEFEIPSGSGRTIAVRNVPSGKRMSVLVARDVTQRVKVREMRRAFVDDVSHELRTPLTVIEGYLEMLLDNDEHSQATREALEHVADQSSRMRNIVEHLLQLSRLEGDPLRDQEGEPIAVAALLRNVVKAVVDTDADFEHSQFTFDVDDELTLAGAESEIWSACNNLVVNALKYAGKDCNVRVTWKLEDGKPVLRVADDGAGIEARHLPRLSERFYRVDRNRSRASGGTGLGLAIVKHAAQRHGGKLTITSTPGVGSRFTVTFPATRVVAPEQSLAG